MANLIDKSAIVAEIERRMEEDVSLDGNGGFASYMDFERYSTLNSILSFIKEELEAKEVDLNEEIKSYFKGFGKFASVGIDDCIDIAKHFFELGLKAQKGE